MNSATVISILLWSVNSLVPHSATWTYSNCEFKWKIMWTPKRINDVLCLPGLWRFRSGWRRTGDWAFRHRLPSLCRLSNRPWDRWGLRAGFDPCISPQTQRNLVLFHSLSPLDHRFSDPFQLQLSLAVSPRFALAAMLLCLMRWAELFVFLGTSDMLRCE